ncbi:SpoIIE family protein phosphatase [Cohnella sp. CFH 77786]|uniref:SpoIIE family protein phosphatase n=1 Tax=Cohnella sp. CFH 77786 TaxID=2662265 RepID=UPI001C60A27F|nr:SpoIIE family protein phosphatase [Cohnella sp. CFH 77786]
MKRKSKGIDRSQPLYDGSVFKVMLLAAVLLVLSTTLIGAVSYRITQNEIVKKLKSQELGTIAKSVSSRVEERIGRAVETATMLADDPLIIEWVKGGEQDARLGEGILAKLRSIPDELDYTTASVLSNETKHYWSDHGLLKTVSPGDPDDDWFFRVVSAGRKTTVNIDWNDKLKDTFVFTDILIGDVRNPLGVAAVGMSLKALSADFASYRYGEDSHLWMVGKDGSIYLSDRFEQAGRNISEYLSPEVQRKLAAADPGQELLLEEKDQEGQLMDMISRPIPSMGTRLLVLVPRSETVGFLSAIRIQTTVAVLFTMGIIVFFFYYVSRKLANPYKQALRINEQLERIVADRTRELERKNREMTDSILYANRIQQTVLPSGASLERAFAGHWVVWKPRDVVGGDFYWTKEVGGVKWVAVGDCTGHGVPGALMTMLVVSLLSRIADQGDNDSPAGVLRKLNHLLKQTLNQTDPEGLTDDGLDLGLCFVRGAEVTFAGAGIAVYISDSAGVRMVKGDKQKIGYRRTPADFEYENHPLPADPDAAYYLASDGVVDQNGGAKNLSLGRTRLMTWLESMRQHPLPEQRLIFERNLAAYMGAESQRDDIVLLAFRSRYSKAG